VIISRCDMQFQIRSRYDCKYRNRRHSILGMHRIYSRVCLSLRRHRFKVLKVLRIVEFLSFSLVLFPVSTDFLNTISIITSLFIRVMCEIYLYTALSAICGCRENYKIGKRRYVVFFWQFDIFF